VRGQMQLAEVRHCGRRRPDLQAPVRCADRAAEHGVPAGLQRQRHRNADAQHGHCSQRDTCSG
jgi:hypothetical protein